MVAEAVADEAPRSAPTPTRPENPRHMADNISWRVAPSPLRGEVLVPFPCVLIVRGTRPHGIRPRGSGYNLRFWWQKRGAIVYPPAVKHPGTAPNPFTVRGLLRGMRGL